MAKLRNARVPASRGVVPVSVPVFNTVATADDLALARAITDATETIIDATPQPGAENDDQPIYIRSGLRNALRAKLALYFLSIAIKRHTLWLQSPDGKLDGKIIIYRVADIAADEFGYFRKHGKLPNYAPESLQTPDTYTFLRTVNGDGSHFAKCIIAAGLVASADLPADILWSSARVTPFYQLPATWRAMVYGDGATPADRFNHQIASDFMARTTPDYHTDRAYAVTVALRRNYRALHTFWRAYLDAARAGNSPDLAYDDAYALVTDYLR